MNSESQTIEVKAKDKFWIGLILYEVVSKYPDGKGWWCKLAKGSDTVQWLFPDDFILHNKASMGLSIS